jgi:protoheme IX farnesyltransferase
LTINDYYYLTKPGIIRGNLIVAMAVFFYASSGDVNWTLFIYSIFGVSLAIASATIANNGLDAKIDAKMSRTNKRATASGLISSQKTYLISIIIGSLGLLILYQLVNPLTAFLGFLSIVFYVFIYGYFKRKSVHGTLIGAIPGAAPPVAGYTAVTGSLDWPALLLFLILLFWQMPHFYAIAIFRKADYKKADLPVLPIVYGNIITKKYIIGYIAAYIFTIALFYAFGYLNIVTFLIITVLNTWWLKLGFDGMAKTSLNDDKWARQIFGFSLLALTVLCIGLIIDSLI